MRVWRGLPGIRILVPMSYLTLWNYVYMYMNVYIYIYIYNVHPSRRVRPVIDVRRPLCVLPIRRLSRRDLPSSVRQSRRVPSCPIVAVVVLRPSIRAVVRPVVVVRPLFVRPRPRPSRCCRPSSVRQSVPSSV